MSALADLRVVEVGSYITAPFCARLFTDFGAEVTKVEPPGGDPTRTRGPFPGDGPDPEQSGMFHYLNAGKASVVADLDDPDDRDFFHELLAGADVFIENTSATEHSRWGFDFETVLERHPHLVIVSLSAYGRSGPWGERPGSDLTAQAASSLPLLLGTPEREPLRLPYDQADYQAAFHGFAAALCALHERETSGLGQGIDISVAQVLGYQVGGMHLVTAKTRNKWERCGTLLKGGIYPTGFFECADGFVCIATQSPKQWDALLELMDNPDWADAEHARDAQYLGQVDETPADPHFREWLKQFSRKDLLELAMTKRIVMGAVQTVDEVLASEQFEFRELWAEQMLDGQTVRVPKAGYQLSKTPTRIAGRGPALNADRDRLESKRISPVRLSRGERGARSLAGVRVLDFGWNWAGPMAGQLLADMGAEVIRIETRKRQDMMRLLDWVSYFFCHNNRNKKSATINIAQPEGARLVRQLARKCDIVMDNFAAGVMTKNGLSYDDIRAENPQIIVVSMSMAGQAGPLRGMRGFASIATAYSGLERMVGYADGEATGLLPFGLGDTTLAIQGVAGALAALHHRRRTGEGQFVDVSQIESATATLGEALLEYQLTGVVPGPQGNSDTHFAPQGLFPAADTDRWIALAVRDEREWQALCKVIGRADLAADQNLAHAAGRRDRSAELDAAITAWSRGSDRDAAAQRLCAAGVPAAPALTLQERDEHPAFQSRAFMAAHHWEGFDPCSIYATPWLLTGTAAEVYGPAPALGSHNDYVFRELLELGDPDIERLETEGILA